MGRIKNLKGQRFGRLIAREFMGTSKNRHALWLCECDCGNKTITASVYLRNGDTVSCGCYNSYVVTKRNYKHGMTKTRIYYIYINMIRRCYDSYSTSFKNYGRRGIEVCCEWLNNPQAFIEWSFENGYTNNLTIDRINNDGNYSPDNCRWVDRSIQGNNKRNNRSVVINGIKKNLGEWAKEIGINQRTLALRIKNGWDDQRLLSPPRHLKEVSHE